jgi:hypothetical protein
MPFLFCLVVGSLPRQQLCDRTHCHVVAEGSGVCGSGVELVQQAVATHEVSGSWPRHVHCAMQACTTVPDIDWLQVVEGVVCCKERLGGRQVLHV